MEDKAPRVYSFSKVAKRKWEDSDKTIKWFVGNKIQRNVYFCLFLSGHLVGCCLLETYFQAEGKKIVGNEKLKKYI